MRRPSGTWVMPLRTTSWAATPTREAPSKRTSPRAGPEEPRERASVVVLPAPLLPSSVTISPWPTRNEMPLRAWISP